MLTDTRFKQPVIHLDWSNLIGKTIQKVNVKRACNIVEITCTDGTELIVDCEPIGYGIYTPVLNTPTDY